MLFYEVPIFPDENLLFSEQQILLACKAVSQQLGSNFLHFLLCGRIIAKSIDAVLYLDMDHIILSNLTEVWEYFEKDQRQNPYPVVPLANHVPPPAKCGEIYRGIPFPGIGGMQSNENYFQKTLGTAT